MPGHLVGVRWGRGFRFAFQKTFELSAIDSEGGGGELGEGRRSRVLVDKAIFYDRFQTLVKLAGEGLIIPLHESLDAAEVGEVGRHRGGLAEVSELSLLGPYDIGVTKGVLQGLGIPFEGLKLGRRSHRGISGDNSHVLVE